MKLEGVCWIKKSVKLGSSSSSFGDRIGIALWSRKTTSRRAKSVNEADS